MSHRCTTVVQPRILDKPPALPPIPSVSKITEVVEAIESIIDWSIGASSRLGYFAALYKRITIAVRTALAQGVFQDAPRMERLDVTFASRYFEALNGYFHPGKFPKPTRSWQVTFNAASRAEPIILQHMLAGVNVHIGLDLGIAAQSISAGGQLPALQEDFNRINAVLASQVGGVVADIDQLSPALADLYAVLTSNEIFLIDEAVKTLRDSAWRFATILSLEPWFLRPMTIWARDWEVAAQVQAIYDPPDVTGLIDLVLRSIAAQESRDIVKNISVLDTIASKPAPIRLDHVTATNKHPDEPRLDSAKHHLRDTPNWPDDPLPVFGRTTTRADKLPLGLSPGANRTPPVNAPSARLDGRTGMRSTRWSSHAQGAPEGTVNLSNPRAIFAGSPPRFTSSRVTYEAYVVSRTSTRPQVDSARRRVFADQRLSAADVGFPRGAGQP